MQSIAPKTKEVRLFAVPSSEPAARPLWRFSTRGVAVRLFLTCWLIYGLHFATNTVREIYPALSLGDHLSFNVSEYSGLHGHFEFPDGAMSSIASWRFDRWRRPMQFFSPYCG